MFSTDHTHVLLLAIFIDALVGDPKWLFRRISHPVVTIGSLINFLDKQFNNEKFSQNTRKLHGIIAIFIILGVVGTTGWLIELVLESLAYGFAIEAVIVAVFLAQNSLYRHVYAVAYACKSNDLDSARKEVSHIVGRDPIALDSSAICRATIESLSENFSDAVVAPIIWYLIGGLPGILAYKALNTSDSMIGHLTERYEHFGWLTARLDDAANFVPARLSAVTIAVASIVIPSTNTLGSVKVGLRDARNHRSINAGWPEAAMAGALGIRLAGPRYYDGILIEDAWMGDGPPSANFIDIYKALYIYCAACGVTAFWVFLLSLSGLF
ncbi:MAG: cobalamin biosynthesis protein CobD [Rhodospirillaceae bacterium]|nr:cobalamin biosynthesis protein CobD [Rhodospirillaceae bacterium]